MAGTDFVVLKKKKKTKQIKKGEKVHGYMFSWRPYPIRYVCYKVK